MDELFCKIVAFPNYILSMTRSLEVGNLLKELTILVEYFPELWDFFVGPLILRYRSKARLADEVLPGISEV